VEILLTGFFINNNYLTVNFYSAIKWNKVVIPCGMHAHTHACMHARRGQGPVGGEKATAPLIRAGTQWRIRE
jgi:hypothetical protein